jgi:hypothetical protein
MGVTIKNNAVGTLVSTITSSDTSLILTTSDGNKFPTLGSGDYFYGTLESTAGTSEIVRVTARVGDVLTAVRAQEGTTASSFSAGTRFSLRITAQTVTDVASTAVDAHKANLALDTLGTNGAGVVGYGSDVTYPSSSLGFVVHSSAMRGSILKHIPRSEWSAHLDYTSAADDTAEIDEWISEISDAKIAGTMPDGIFRYAGAGFSQNYVRIKGSSKPRVNAALTALEGGSIIVGTGDFFGDLVDIENVGFDHGATNFPSTADDALRLAGAASGKFCRLSNVIGLCRNRSEAFHAILVEGYDETDIDGIVGIYSYYGAALKPKKGNIKNVRGYYNGVAGCIVRSNSGDGVVEDLIIDGIQCYGSGNSGFAGTGSDYGFYLVADTQAERIIVNNVICQSSKNSIAVRANANVNDVMLSNLIVRDTECGIYLVTGTADIYHTQITNAQVVETTAWALRAEEGLSIGINNFYGSSTASSSYIDELIRIESPVVTTMMDSVKLVENRGATQGAIYYLNTAANNRVGTNMFCRYRGALGVGVPERTVQSTATGATVTLTPDFDPSGRIYLRSARGGVASTVTTIVNAHNPASTRFQRGTLLFVHNDDVSVLTIGAGAANVVSKSGGAIAIPASNFVVFVFTGANWAEV